MRKPAARHYFLIVSVSDYGCMQLRHTHPQNATWALHGQCYSTTAPVLVAAATRLVISDGRPGPSLPRKKGFARRALPCTMS